MGFSPPGVRGGRIPSGAGAFETRAARTGAGFRECHNALTGECLELRHLRSAQGKTFLSRASRSYLPAMLRGAEGSDARLSLRMRLPPASAGAREARSEEHTSELQ